MVLSEVGDHAPALPGGHEPLAVEEVGAGQDLVGDDQVGQQSTLASEGQEPWVNLASGSGVHLPGLVCAHKRTHEDTVKQGHLGVRRNQGAR